MTSHNTTDQAPPDPAMEYDAEYEDEGPYCTCDEDPYEEEAASNVCSSCGKLLS